MKWFSDFVFWDRAKGNILATESLPEGDEMEYAQRLANEHKTTVAYGVVCDYFVSPMLCPRCGEPVPGSGPCPCSSFEEEEAGEVVCT